MPANIVKPGEETAWNRAKRAVRKQYPDISEDNPRFYKLTTTLFNNMKALDAMDLIDQDDDAEAHRTGHLHKAIVGLRLHPARRVILGAFLPPGEPLARSYVRAHTRTTPSGRTIHIPAYFTKRTAAQKEGAKPRKARALKEQPSAKVHPGQSHEQLAHRLVRHVHEGSMSHEEAEANLAHLERRAHAGHHLEHGTGAAWTPEQTHQFIAHARGRLAEHKAGQEREAQAKRIEEVTGKREQAEPQRQEPGRQGPPRGITQQERQQQWDEQMRQRQRAERERATPQETQIREQREPWQHTQEEFYQGIAQQDPDTWRTETGNPWERLFGKLPRSQAEDAYTAFRHDPKEAHMQYARARAFGLDHRGAMRVARETVGTMPAGHAYREEVLQGQKRERTQRLRAKREQAQQRQQAERERATPQGEGEHQGPRDAQWAAQMRQREQEKREREQERWKPESARTVTHETALENTKPTQKQWPRNIRMGQLEARARQQLGDRFDRVTHLKQEWGDRIEVWSKRPTFDGGWQRRREASYTLPWSAAQNQGYRQTTPSLVQRLAEQAQQQARPSQTPWQQQEQALRGQARGRFEQENQRRGRPVAKSLAVLVLRRAS
jgi:hypothetical protein